MNDAERIAKALKLLEEQEAERAEIRVEYASLFDDCRIITDAPEYQSESTNNTNPEILQNLIIVAKQVAELHRVKFTPIKDLVKKEEKSAGYRDKILNRKPRKL